MQVVNPTGHLGLIGVFFPQDPGGVNQEAKQGTYLLPMGQIWDKGLTIGTGQTPVKRYNEYLRDLIIAGRAHPGTIISQHLPLSAAPDAYRQFDERAEGFTKVVLQPGQAA